MNIVLGKLYYNCKGIMQSDVMFNIKQIQDINYIYIVYQFSQTTWSK